LSANVCALLERGIPPTGPDSSESTIRDDRQKHRFISPFHASSFGPHLICLSRCAQTAALSGHVKGP
jgi:hypothetical protein